MTTINTQILPLLPEAGVDEEQIRLLIIGDPRRPSQQGGSQ